MELVDAPHSKCGTFGFVGSSPTAPTCLMNTYQRLPLSFKKGKGCWLWDQNGHKYLDAVAGIATCSLGHSDRVLRKELSKQLNKVQHISNLYQITEQEELASWLINNSCADKAFFCNSGAEAVEAAIKLARKYGHIKQGLDTPIILSAKGSFHGRTLAALSATGQKKYQKGFEPLLEGFRFFSYNNVNEIENLFKQIPSEGQQISAVIIEALQGEGGVNPGEKVFFKRLKELCEENKTLLILDEIQTGMGRCGHLWGYQQLGIEPDIFTTAKGLGGGHAIGSLLVKEHANLFEPGDHASTFGGNPFACKAGLTVAKEIERRNIIHNVQTRGMELKEGLIKITNIFSNHFSGVRGWGLLQGIVIRDDVDLTSQMIVKAGVQNKLLLVGAGQKVIRFVPPLTINQYEVKELLKKLKSAIESCL